MFYDYWYLLFVMLPGMVISLYAQFKIKHAYNKYSKISNRAGMTGEMSARKILSDNNLSYVKVERVSGELTDNYNPSTERISLSDGVFGSSSIAAVGIAAHEAGHALQYADNYAPIKLRTALVPVTRFGSQFSFILLFVGLILNSVGLYLAGIIAFSTIVLFQLITLPVEFNASSRAMKILASDGTLSEEELKGAKQVLSAAALTYVAALLTSLLQLLYYMSKLRGKKR